VADNKTRACLEGEAGLHRDGDKAAMAKYFHWPLLLDAGLVWARNNKTSEEYPDGKYPDTPDGRPNFMGGIAYTKIVDSILRHIFAFLAGEDKDPETELPHLAHALCCLSMLAYQVDYHPTLDDRTLQSKAVRAWKDFFLNALDQVMVFGPAAPAVTDPAKSPILEFPDTLWTCVSCHAQHDGAHDQCAKCGHPRGQV
jgi:hypothetical protein